MIITIKNQTNVERDLEYLSDAIANGTHTEVFKEGDIIEIAGIEHVIIGMDVEEGFTHSMTIQRRNKVYDQVFAYNGSSNYEKSDIRGFLDSEYMSDFPDDFLKLVSPVKIDGMSGEDRFFLLSSRDLDPAKTKYPYYRKIENRTKYDEEGFVTWWWLRDPVTGNSNFPRIVYTTGLVATNYATYAYGVSPACIIGHR